MRVDLLHIELVKLELMHSLEILHTKQDLVRAVSMLMQYVPTIHALTWAVLMHREAPKKAQSAQSG
jgi:hypothetical protein